MERICAIIVSLLLFLPFPSSAQWQTGDRNFTPVSGASAAFVAGSGSGCTTTASGNCAISGYSYTGNNVIIALCIVDAAETCSVSGSVNTYTGQASFAGYEYRQFYTALNASSGSETVTCTRSASGGAMDCLVFQYANTPTSSYVDTLSAGAGKTGDGFNRNTTSFTAGGNTTAHAKDIVIGGIDNENPSTTFTATGGFTSRYTFAGGFFTIIEDDSVSTAGTYTATATASATATGTGQSIALESN